MAVTVKVRLDEPKIRRRLLGNDFGLFTAEQWKLLINPYTPRNTGMLEEQATIAPWTITYDRRYAHYMYEGEVYVDPVYHCSGFWTKDGWKSRYHVDKIPSGRSFNYRKTNPFATDHWDQKAAQAGQLEKLIRISERALNARKF